MSYLQRVAIIEKLRSTAMELVDQDEYCQVVEMECDKATRNLMAVESKAEVSERTVLFVGCLHE